MSKKLIVSGVILLIVGVIIVASPEEIRIHIQVFPLSMIGIFLGVVGIVLAIMGLGTILAERL